MSEPLVYLNGRMVPASQAHLAIYDAGIVLGATVTEQTRTFHKRLWRLDDHLDRLFRSLRYARMNIGLSKEQLAGISNELVEHNARLLDDAEELGLIHFVTAGEYLTYAGVSRGSATTGGTPVPPTGGTPVPPTGGTPVLPTGGTPVPPTGETPVPPGPTGETPVPPRPTVCVHTFPLPFEMWAKKMLSGAHVVTPSIRQVPPQCYDPKMKCRSRMHYYLAEQEARLVDPEASALLLDLAGNVTETSAANFLIVERGGIVSPTTVNTLTGVSRAMVHELAGKLGIPFVERDFQVYDVMNADEAFTTSTPYCLMPVTKINGVAIGNGEPGPMTRRLLAAWSAEVGLDIEKQIQEGAALRMKREQERS
ncbi:MAG TPA: aminotransferase class IV [Gemmataceae bacterium]|nr:aminotransferase class IV [Gemmataceae bacterium]